jgi:hypothetical protein
MTDDVLHISIYFQVSIAFLFRAWSAVELAGDGSPQGFNQGVPMAFDSYQYDYNPITILSGLRRPFITQTANCKVFDFIPAMLLIQVCTPRNPQVLSFVRLLFA